MKSFSLTPSRRTMTVLCGAALAAGLCASFARADEWDKKTVLTVQNQPIQIRDTVLEPGQYVLKLLDSQSERHVVQIFNRDQSHIINTVIANAAERLEPAGHTTFTFWETPPGTAKAMRTWYYPGDLIGVEFPYPKHLQQIAMAAPPPAPAVEEAPAPAPEPQAESQPESQPEQPAPAPEVAQNAPPAPPEEAPAPAPPQQLPTTGSPYPLIGLTGVGLLALYGLLKWRRTA